MLQINNPKLFSSNLVTKCFNLIGTLLSQNNDFEICNFMIKFNAIIVKLVCDFDYKYKHSEVGVLS